MRAGRGRRTVVPAVISAVVLVTAACAGDAPPPEVSELPETGLEAPSAAADPGRYQGILTVEGGTEITLCDGGIFPVDGPASLALLEIHASLAPGVEPMEGIFVDVLGQIRDDDGNAWLDALEVMRGAWEGWGCGTRDTGILYRAAGTEPFWSLSVADSTAEWRTPDGLEQFVHSGPWTMSRGGWALEGEPGGQGPAFRAEFLDEPCRDAMSGAYSHLTARVVIGGAEFRGCAYRAPGAPAEG